MSAAQPSSAAAPPPPPVPKLALSSGVQSPAAAATLSPRGLGQGILLDTLPHEIASELREIDADNSGSISVAELRLAVRTFTDSKKKVQQYSRLFIFGLVLFCVMTIIQFGVM